MPKPGNTKLVAARVAAGYRSQEALAAALDVTVRQVGRWESANPPWPQPVHQERLTRLLGQSLTDLGFTPPTGRVETSAPRPGHLAAPRGTGSVPSQGRPGIHPAAVADHYTSAVIAHRGLYWTVAPSALHPSVLAHAGLGHVLLQETAGATRQRIATALAETYLLAGRIEFFDVQQPERAADTWVRALQAAGEADDPLLGSAILAHTAFIPGWRQQHDEAAERMTAARTYARRGPASALHLAWLDAVEAECETRCGNTRTALHLLRHAETLLADGTGPGAPEWLNWFSPARLAAFKGNTELMAGLLPQARDTLLGALDSIPSGEDKQKSVILGDLAAVEAAAKRPEEACAYALRALAQLRDTWYATGMERVREVRRALMPWQHEPCVRDLDDQLYGWETTVSALVR
ncbi:multiprotein-bridging factor 1 family protein [Streptomyces sp. WAC08241]|uniref:helix-turn-helix domain-containing protein n=1 Tax=Streptomyces sp. WAC08241 TaxID=2487421 RepID=UPI000F76A7CF|nr:transcriptional regulator [Streptomyces sp. WAC08241]RSS36737.1 transcriptional regulator [Streptomyces sp. WAC08241]